MSTFIQPNNNHKVHNDLAPLWCFLFGSFYFLYKGATKHAIISLVVAIFTGGIAWFIYPFFASSLVENSFLERGFVKSE